MQDLDEYAKADPRGYEDMRRKEEEKTREATRNIDENSSVTVQ